MKKLGKLSINPEKIINNEELVNLKGGYGGYGGQICVCTNSSGVIGNILLPIYCSTSGCTTECRYVYGSQGGTVLGTCKS